MTTLRMPVLLAALILLAACVTINVYFPAAAAQEAADRIINQVYGAEGQTPAQPSEKQPPAAPAPAQPAPEPQSRRGELFMQIAGGALNWVISPAAAAEPDIDIQSPAIRKITADLERRHPSLASHYASGAIGMTNDGRLAVRDLNAVPLRERSRVQQLLAEENRERTELYAEIARANGHPEWEADIRATFARRWVANAPAGWWYQTAQGDWKRK